MTAARVLVMAASALVALVLAGWSMRRRGRAGVAWLAIACLALASMVDGARVRWGVVHAAREALFEGVSYEREVRTVPRPIVLHWVQIARDAPGISFEVSPRAEGGGAIAETTRDFVRRSGVAVGMNASFFVYPQRGWTPWHDFPERGERVDCLGLAYAHGEALCDASWEEEATLYLGPGSRAALTPPEGGIVHAISGRRWLVRGGTQVLTEASDDDPRPYPRAAVGLAGRALLLLAVDGHVEGRREGMTLAEVAEAMLARGAHDAIELDGGGSVSLAMRTRPGQARMLDVPAARDTAGWERVVGVSFGVHAEPLDQGVVTTEVHTGPGGSSVRRSQPVAAQ